MRTRELDRRRTQSPLWRILAGRPSWQVVVGALAIAAIVLAFIFRPGESSQEAKLDTAARPTASPVAMVTLPTAVPSPTSKPERIHVVAQGDSLTAIAQKYYGDASKWNKIFEANRDILPSANSLQIGQKLRIPD